MQRSVAGQIFSFLAFFFINTGFIIVFAFQTARLADAGLAARTFAPAVRTFAGFVGINITFIILAGTDSDLEIAFALLGIFPVAGADLALIIFAAAAVGFGNAGRLFAAGAAVIIIGPVFRQLVGLAFASSIFAVAGGADTDIALAVAFIFIISRTLAIRIESQLAALLSGKRIVITDHRSRHFLGTGASGQHAGAVEFVLFISGMAVTVGIVPGAAFDNITAVEDMTHRTI